VWCYGAVNMTNKHLLKESQVRAQSLRCRRYQLHQLSYHLHRHYWEISHTTDGSVILTVIGIITCSLWLVYDLVQSQSRHSYETSIVGISTCTGEIQPPFSRLDLTHVFHLVQCLWLVLQIHGHIPMLTRRC
jgi:hypothetical protein